MKSALITGITGQDGTYLAELLYSKGYKLYGAVGPQSDLSKKLKNQVQGVMHLDLRQAGLLKEYIREVNPDEIYHLAAHHFSSEKRGNYVERFEDFLSINLNSTNEILATLRTDLPKCRLFFAASCQIFGNPDHFPQDENTPHRPENLYAITKSAAVQLCRYYRKQYRMYICSGILYNHESARRKSGYVTTKIAKAAALAKLGRMEPLFLENMEAVVDWGAAKDYVEAMWLTLNQSAGDDYIIASGIPRKVRDFAMEAFRYLGLKGDMPKYIIQKSKPTVHQPVPYIGDNSKIKKVCSWRPSTPFAELVAQMVDEQLTHLKSTS